jgi:O-antigen ligase
LKIAAGGEAMKKNYWRFAGLAGLWLFAGVTLLSIAAQNIIFLGFAAWFLRGCLKEDLRFPQPLQWWLLFLAWSFFAAFYAENRGHTFDTWKRWLLAFAAWYAAGALKDRTALKSVLGSLLFFSALWCLGASLIALFRPLKELIGGLPWSQISQQWLENGDWRAESGSGGYMVLGTGSMLVLLFFSGLCLEDPHWRKPLVLACLGCLACALLLTLTRSAWLGAFCGLLALFSWKKPRWAFGLALLVAFLLAAFPGSPFSQRVKNSLDMTRNSNRERIYMAKTGLAIIRDYPWMGVGDSLESHEFEPEPGMTVKASGVYLRYKTDEEKQFTSLRDQDQGHLHNNLIMLAVITGLPGLGLALIFFLRLFWMAGKSVSLADPLAAGLGLGIWAALIGWWINGMFEYNFCSTQSSFTLWFLIGLFLAGRELGRGDAVTR